MTYTLWDALKDFLGAVGPVMIAIPWFRDFYLRRRKRKVEGIKTAGTALQSLKDLIQTSLREKIESPKVSDFVWTASGLFCIFCSFFIAFVRGLPELL
jgi:hypothetical protein